MNIVFCPSSLKTTQVPAQYFATIKNIARHDLKWIIALCHAETDMESLNTKLSSIPKSVNKSFNNNYNTSIYFVFTYNENLRGDAMIINTFRIIISPIFYLKVNSIYCVVYTIQSVSNIIKNIT